YFAVADTTDLRAITWRRGTGYDEGALSNLYTGNDARTRVILREISDKIIDPGAMRALGFCVSVSHARYMAAAFNAAGIPAAAVTGETLTPEREERLRQLRERELNVLFTVDLFNEGLDIPDIDTILLLRPTQSATIFLQQLGRGLRRTPHKAVLTVLDFVGLQRAEFRFAPRYRALTGLGHGRLVRAIETGFPFLPSGFQIVMDRVAQEVVLDNVKSQVSRRWPQLVAEARSYGDLTLARFLEESGLELPALLRRGQRSWTQLRREAGLPTAAAGPAETVLMRRLRALAHVDDPTRAETYRRVLAGQAPRTTLEATLAEMLFFSLWPDGGGHASVNAGLASLQREAAFRQEAQAVLDLVFDESRQVTHALDGALSDVPLRVHGQYQREEVLAALGYASLARKPNSFREGVLHVPDRNVDALFVTLRKSEADYSPTTMYRDYPIDQVFF